MTLIAHLVGLLAGAWLMALGVWMGLVPRRGLAALAAMGSSPAIHFGEMTVRLLIGAALVVAGPTSRFPVVIALIGAFLVVSAIVLMVLPRRWHAAYSTWWAARIPVIAVRIIAPLSILGGLLLIWSVGLPPRRGPF